jgi:hypothetical protein
MFMSTRPSYRGEPIADDGWGGPKRASFSDIGDDITREVDSHGGIDEDDDESHNIYSHLHDLVNTLEEKMENEGTSSKHHKISTPAPEKPGKREYVFKRGEKTLKPIPLQTKAFPDFVNDPLVPHAYLVKTA